jgi:hypothetical protein
MHSAKLTMAKFLYVLLVTCLLQTATYAQENSPYSRYGIGDLVPNHNILSRGMGGIAAGYSDNFSVNFTNPAALSNIALTVFDIGGEIDNRTLKSKVPAKKYTSTNTLISYLQLGFPLTTPKMRKKGIDWGMSFGLKPVSRINYKIEKNERTPIDSLNTLYEGSGGLNQINLGTGIKYKGFSFGINTGFMFGNKDYSTQLVFINDTVDYAKSNSATQTRYSGLFLNAGMQYETQLKKGVLRLGVYGNLAQKLNAKQDNIRETFFFDGNGGIFRLDSVYEKNDVKGKVELPATVGLGFTYTDNNWLFGADFEMSNWSKYRYYGQADALQNSFVIRAGAQYYPAKIGTPFKKYFKFVNYRAGFYYGPDYVKTTAAKHNEFGFTVGAGFPLTQLNNRFQQQQSGSVILNTGLEIGNRGNNQSNLRENIVRFSIGVTMNARWFIKRKYD